VYDKILVAVDHSETSGRALLAARDLAVLSHGEVWVLHLREREGGAKTGQLTRMRRRAGLNPRSHRPSRRWPGPA